jgi:hypothetical protein
MAALAACDLLPGDAIHNTKRFLEVPDYLDVVSELARLFVDLVPAAGAEEDDRPLPDTEEEFLALLLGRLSADHPNLGAPGSSPPPDGDPNIGGFNPGSGSPPPPARLDLAQWYWSRAPILDALPDLKIRKLDKIERDVVGLERVQTRESVSHGVKLERPLRHRAFRPVEDDPAEIDFSHVMVSGDVPIVDYLTFGVGRIHPAIAVPVERRWSTLRETLRRETALVEIEFDVANLAGGADLFDQILFVRDSSGSMGGFKEGTPLDCVTLGVFSVLKTLEFREEARRFRYGAVDFSNSTHFSGYVGWDNRDEFERVVLTGQNGGTTVDVGVVREALSGPDRTLVLFLSDGELAVSAGTPDELITLLMKHSPYVVAAGGLSTFCKQCADAGIVTLILDRIDSVATVFSAIATGTA